MINQIDRSKLINNKFGDLHGKNSHAKLYKL